MDTWCQCFSPRELRVDCVMYKFFIKVATLFMFHNTVKVEKIMILLKGAMTMSYYLLSFLKELKHIFTSGVEFENNGPDYIDTLKLFPVICYNG